MVIESLETRAMLAGVGPESWSAPGIAPAPLGTVALLSSGVILTCSSPTPGSSGTSSPPAPTSGSGGTTSGGNLWDSYSAGAGGSKSGSTGGVSTNGPALSSQYNGGSGAGRQGNGTVGPLTNAELWRLYWSGAGAGSSSSGADEGSLADDPAISAQYTGGSGGGRITPLVYNPESDGPPVFHSGVWTGDDGSVQFVQTVDTGNANAGTDPPNRPTWDDVKDWYSGPRWQFEVEAGLGMYDSPDEESKPKDEFASIPTDENGNYSWLSRQKYLDFLGQIVQTGKAFAWHMAEWFGPDEAAKIAKPLIAGGKGLAVIAIGAGRADDGADALNAGRRAFLAGKTIPELKEVTSALPWNQLWGTGAPGAIDALGKLRNGGKILLDVISRRSLEAYAELARRALADPQSATDVQRIRLEIIEELLRGM